MSAARRVVCVAGASSPVAEFPLPRLSAEGARVYALSRRPRAVMVSDGPVWLRAELEGAAALPAMPGVEILVHLAPLWLLPPRVADFAQAGVRRILAFGSTSRDTKAASAEAGEQALAARLAEAEGALAEACARHGIAWTLFRPTLTYGSGRDENVAFIRRFVSRFGFFPLAGEARGLRQPVHADDLAAACVAALDCPAAFNRAYNLGGGECLSYRRMVEAVFRAAGRAPRLISLPLPLWRLVLLCGRALPGVPSIGTEMVLRMNSDMVFDIDAARRDFGYAPRPFQP